MQHLRILILTALMLSISFVSPAQAQRGPNSLDNCANNTNAFWSLTYQGTEESHDSSSVRVCADVDGELGNIPRIDRISSNNDLISLSVELRTGYQITFFSETNFGGERLVFTGSRTETNPFEVFSYIVEPLPEVVEPLDWVSTSREVIGIGGDHTCAVRADRTVVCWGRNSRGQTNVPASVQGETVQIALGHNYTCALQADRTVVCWGGDNGQTNVPASVQGEAAQVAADTYTCALQVDRTVVCWGGDNGQTTVPSSVQGETVQIATGWYHTCALRADRRVVCWGNNWYGTRIVPDSVQGEAVQISAGVYYTCALQADRTVACWGQNNYGQTTVPDSVQGEAVQIATGDYHTCALQADRTVVCWGANGSNNYVNKGQTTVPASVQGETVQITAGWHHTCALRADRTVVCWGDNHYGQVAVPGGLRVDY